MKGGGSADVGVQRAVGFPHPVMDDLPGSDVRANKAPHRCPVGMSRIEIQIVIGVHVVAEVLLFLIGQALGGLALDFGPGQGRQQHPSQDGDDGNNHQKFNQSEGPRSVHANGWLIKKSISGFPWR